MLALIRKEWRENRALVWGFLVIAPVLSFALKQWIAGWEKTEPWQSVFVVVPALTALYLLAVGADIVAGDTGSGRIALTAAQPVRPLAIWTAKVAFLFGSAALFAVYAGIVEWALLSIAGIRDPETARLQDVQYLAVAVPPLVGAAVLFFSTLIDRGIAAAFAAVVFLAAAGLGLKVADPKSLGFGKGLFPLLLFLAALVTTGLLLGSGVAFTRGRIWLGARARRIAFGTGAFFVAVILPVGVVSASIAGYFDLDPTDADLVVHGARVDPYGRWAYVRVARADGGPLGLRAGNDGWAVRLDDGVVRMLPASALSWSSNEEDLFPAPDRIVLRTCVPKQRLEYDLAHERVVDTKPYRMSDLPKPHRPYGPHRWTWFPKGQSGILREGRPPLVLPSHCMISAWSDWGVACQWHRKGAAPEWGAWKIDDGEWIHVADPMPGGSGWYIALLPETPDGFVTASRTHGREDIAYYTIHLGGGEPEPLLRGDFRSSTLSPHGRFFVTWLDGRLRVLRGGSREVGDLGPMEVGGLDLSYAAWSPDDRRFAFTTKAGLWLGDTAAMTVRRIADVTADEAHPQWTDGDRIVLVGRGLWLVTADGAVHRLLPK